MIPTSVSRAVLMAMVLLAMESSAFGFQSGLLPSGFRNARRYESVVKMSGVGERIASFFWGAGEERTRASLFRAGPPARTLTPDEVATYDRDGVVLVRGLLRGAELEHAIAAAEAVVQETTRAGSDLYRVVTFQGWRTNRALRRVAMDSASPSIAAQVMGLSRTQPLHVMKDAMLAMDPGNIGCGWHVDDKFFWPVEDVPPGADAPVGCNVWIALTPVSTHTGGGLAVAAGSSSASWREECRSVITGEEGGGEGRPRTCRMAELSPAFDARFENLKLLHDMAPGDALVHTRYCFHRSELFTPAAAGAPTRVAYSIRYETAEAKLFRGGASGSNAETISLGSVGAYYPQVWPRSRPLERLAVSLGLIKADDF
eukprot:CAMPEP_0180138232 /NCGR_PEP_ID=MMETSP0986-20121125/12742_1 /TAXON_ID=697907 /ORGANISM="non described non described, Strain CCMP2293" /LENGTH=370 /DNA_ID=CAMNT_0022079959 /DNA_START=47 /DNA_END=1159 /DNA_ORIENTATION=-